MATYQVKEEFTIPFSKAEALKEYRERVQRLFRVAVTFDSPHAASDVWWIHLEGQRADVENGKVFIKSLCNPETKTCVPVPERFYVELLDHAKDVERNTKAVVTFPSRKESLIQGSGLAVAMASSMIEQKVSDLKSGIGNPVPTRQPRSDIDPSLKEFAIKLGYTEQDINQAVRKLGADVDQNTLLHELIKISTSSPMQLSAQARPKDETKRNMVNPAIPMPRRDRSPRDVVRRGAAPRRTTTSSTTQNGADVVSSPYPTTADPALYTRGPSSAWQGSHERTVQSDEGLQDKQETEKMYYQLLSAKGKGASSHNRSDLRPIVVDGSNVAMSHGHQDVFSCKGIKLCVEYFQKRGHKEIYVFVPQWRKEAPRHETPMTDQDILFSLEREGTVVFTPSRKLENGRRIVCYDDRFVIKLAADIEGIIVSNDNFRDLCSENSQWKEAIEHRLLMYSFVGDIFMVPDDPLGRHGPTLDDFMRKGTVTQPRICPYLKRCTYGLRCRFYHPEREVSQTPVQPNSGKEPVSAVPVKASPTDLASKKISVLKEMFPLPQQEPIIRELVYKNPNKEQGWFVDQILALTN